MNHPPKRNAAQQTDVRPGAGPRGREQDPGFELTEGHEESDWALWEDSVQQFESGAMPLDPFERISRRDR